MKLIFTLILILFLLSSCIQNPFNKTPGNSGKGSLDVTILTSPKLDGKTLNEGDTFTVDVDVINSLDVPIQGRICLRDQTTDTFGGISSTGENCDNLDLAPAERLDDSGKLFPDKGTYLFPLDGDFSYRNLDVTSLPNQIFVDLFYELQTQNEGIACIERRGVGKCQTTQNLNIAPKGVPLEATKIIISPSYRGDEVILNAEVVLSQKEEGTILTAGSVLDPNTAGTQRVKVDVEINRNLAKCNTLNQGYVEFKKGQNEKIIKCTLPVSIPLEYENVPVKVTLEYGFQKTVQGPKFNLKKEDLIA